MIKKCTLVYMISTLFSRPILMKLEFSRNFFEKPSNIKFHENPSSGSRDVPCGRADVKKLIIAFHTFANEPKNTP